MSVLNSAVSGMLANTNWLTTIAQNVANANTTGYKNVETNFSALVDGGSQSTSSQLAGVTTSTVAMNSLQGQLQQTSSTTDLAVQGTGYFVVENASGQTFLTRNGSFVPDASGNLVNGNGYYLLGAPVTAGAAAVNSLSNLTKVNVNSAGDAATPSTSATLTANLPATAAVVTGDTPSSNAADSQYTAETSLVAYDNLGGANTINVYFTKTGADTWEADAYSAADAASSGGFPYSSGPLATSTLTFNPQNGALTSGSPFTFTVPNGQAVSVNLSSTTQLAASFGVTSTTVNGYGPSALTGVSVAPNGTLSFNYGGGANVAAYTIPLASVASPTNMTSVLGDAFQTNLASGAPQIGTPETGGLGAINSSQLEASTVDLATELTQMVEAQSAYEANSKVFQAGAKLLDVLNNIQA